MASVTIKRTHLPTIHDRVVDPESEFERVGSDGLVDRLSKTKDSIAIDFFREVLQEFDVMCEVVVQNLVP